MSDALITWGEVCDFLRTRHEVLEEGEDRITLLCAARGARQTVEVESRHAHREAWILVLAPLPDAVRPSPEVLLAHNARLAVGAAARDGGRTIMRHALPLAGLHGDDLARAVQVVADEAARLAQGPQCPELGSVFDAYAL